MKKKIINWNWYIYLCWRKLSCRLKYFPHTSQAYVNSGLLWVRSWIIKLYGLVKRRWQNLHTNSHFGRILRRKSDRRSSLSIRITANILSRWKNWRFFSFWLFHTHSRSAILVYFPLKFYRCFLIWWHHTRAKKWDYVCILQFFVVSCFIISAVDEKKEKKALKLCAFI